MLGEDRVASKAAISTDTLNDSAPLGGPTPFVIGPAARARAERAVSGLLRRIPWPICVITLLAGILRFVELSGVNPNPFYDAAVRSMSMSAHNFFFGAFDPAAILSVDKPPLDLWLQVLSVKLFGWGRFSLQLPEALGGTLSVPLLYDAVRRVVGRPAGLAAAAALAVFPESVLTSRSDTMDSVMMLLVIAALWLTIRAIQEDRRRPLVFAGVALGLAFNVKLLESLVSVPALVVLYWIGARVPVARKLKDLAWSGVALVGVGLSWAVAVSLAPGRHPWAVGSTDGSVWNAMFVFNGFGKVSNSASTKPGGPGPFRLLVSTGWHYDMLFGCVLVAALAIGLAAALVVIRDRRRGASRLPRMSRALIAALAVWTALDLVIFDTMATVHTRYLEAMAPALAAAIGYGAAILVGLDLRRGRLRTPSLAAITVALASICAYAFSFRPPRVAMSAVALIFATAGAALLARAPGQLGHAAKWLTGGLIVICAMTFPIHETISLVRTQADDSRGLSATSTENTAALSRYLQPRTAGVRYELAVDEPLSLAPLIIEDQRPILPLTTFAGQPLTRVAELVSAVRSGAVRYGLVGSGRCDSGSSKAAACTTTARWIRLHGVDVTSAVGLSGPSHLYLLLPARAA